MWFQSLLGSWKLMSTRRGRPQPRPTWRSTYLVLEHLEDRCLPSSYSAANVTQLIADIKAANQAGGTNTIALTAAASSPYVLTTVDNTKDGPTGLPVISGNKTAVNLTIIGNGDTIEWSRASSSRLFDVAGGATLTLEYLTLHGGNLYGGSGVSAEGGAVYNQGTLVLSGVTVQDNEIVAAWGGNGKASKSGQPGSDAQGAGIWSDGSLTLENGAAIVNNTAVGGGGGGGSTGGAGGNAFGGGLYVAGGAVNISSTTIAGNTAEGGAGGVGALVPVFDGGYTYRDGAGGNALGGAVYVAAGQVAVTGVSLNNNSAQGGPGGPSIYSAYAPWGNAFGGAICVAGGSVSLSSDTVEYNSATQQGANPSDGIPSDGDDFGGGICVVGGAVSLSSDTVNYNTATDGSTYALGPFGLGGGVYIASGATVTFCNDTVEFNAASAFGNFAGNSMGGGIEIAGGAVYIDAATVANTTNNTDANSGLNGSTANIDGSYTLQNC
jgi:hypothetical protein